MDALRDWHIFEWFRSIGGGILGGRVRPHNTGSTAAVEKPIISLMKDFVEL